MGKKRRFWLITLALVLASGAVVFALLRPEPEPVYGGKTLTEWLVQYRPNDGNHPLDSQVVDAIRHIGTNAIPTLLHMLRAKNLPLTLKLFDFLRDHRLLEDTFVTAEDRNAIGATGFEVLGAYGKSAVPLLTEIVDGNNTKSSRSCAAIALGGIGPDAKQAIPALLKAATNNNELLSGLAVKALGEIHSGPEIVVPVLLKLTSSTNRPLRRLAIQALGDFGPDASNAVPALVTEVINPTSRLRYEAMRVLGKIHTDPERVVPVLITSLSENNLSAQAAAAEGLSSFGADARPAVPFLINILKNGDATAKNFVRAALIKIEPEAAAEAGVK